MFLCNSTKKLKEYITLYLSVVLLAVCSLSYAHTPNAYLKENKYIISEPVLNMHEECSEDSPYVSQGIYGHTVSVIEDKGDGWALVETEDGYQGYSLLDGLVNDNPRWKTSKKLCKVASLAGMVYCIADTERPALMRLPFGARIELLQGLDTNTDRWLEVRLVDGRTAWMQRGDLEQQHSKGLEEIVELSQKFQELPYIWGGTSSEGYDCSGFVQTLCKEIGILLPRDSRPQADSDKVIPIDYPERPGDLVFFGNTRITHVGLYLGAEKFIHSGVRDHKPKIAISTLGQCDYNLLAARRLKEVTYKSEIFPISRDIQDRMEFSWRKNNPVSLQDLRYIALNHWGFDGCVHQGELIVHKDVAEEVSEIFGELFAKKYPIEKMLLVDAYQADDALACEDNNSSAFCSRLITGSASEWSYHSFGLAIDVNPLLNPYHKGNVVVPENGKPFLDRSIDCVGVITEEDPCYKAFISRGWLWGGHWSKERGYVDYQHFYKEIPIK